jgi:hypothetical protein
LGKLPKGSPQVSMRKNSGFRLTGFRCITCVPPHTLRQAGGSEAVELDKVRRRPLYHTPPSLPSPLCALRERHGPPSLTPTHASSRRRSPST